MDSGFLLFRPFHFQSFITNPKEEIRWTEKGKISVHRISIKCSDNQLVQNLNILILRVLKQMFNSLIRWTMADMIKILFYVRKTKTNSEGLAPIYMRVTVNGNRFETATSKYVDVGMWSNESMSLVGKSKEVNSLNDFLQTLRLRLTTSRNSCL
jgi:hypothetical protein